MYIYKEREMTKATIKTGHRYPSPEKFNCLIIIIIFVKVHMIFIHDVLHFAPFFACKHKTID